MNFFFFFFLLLRNTDLILEASVVQDNTLFFFSSHVFTLFFGWWPPRRVLPILSIQMKWSALFIKLGLDWERKICRLSLVQCSLRPRITETGTVRDYYNSSQWSFELKFIMLCGVIWWNHPNLFHPNFELSQTCYCPLEFRKYVLDFILPFCIFLLSFLSFLASASFNVLNKGRNDFCPRFKVMQLSRCSP